MILVAAYVSFFATLIGNLPTTYSGTSSGSISNMLLYIIGLYGVIIAVGIVSIIALVLFVIAMHNLSKYYSEPSIFRNVIYSIVNVVGSLVIAGIFMVFIFATIGSYANLGATPVSTSPLFGFGLILVFIVETLVLSIAAVVFFRRAFCNLADKSGVENFRTAGLLFLIGIIVPFVNYVALVFAALGFHRLAPAQTSPSGYVTTPYVASANGPVKRCLRCGAENSPESHYCRTCGNPLS